MKPEEQNIDVEQSDYVIHTPSAVARKTFLYLLRCGSFTYQPGYRLERAAFDSFLILFIRSGALDLVLPEGRFCARTGQFAIVDCYAPHQYGTSQATEVIWMHFDGIAARSYYDLIVRNMGNVFLLRHGLQVTEKLNVIDKMAHDKQGFSESRMSQIITDILTECVIGGETNTLLYQSKVVQYIIAYISAHIRDSLTISDLAEHASLSEYRFTQIFKNETGMTPHEYVIDARLHMAQYLLINSEMTLRQICERSGFSTTSVFCTAFKRKMGMSPLQYRTVHRGVNLGNAIRNST